MSIPVRSNLDLGLNQLLSAILEVLSADPGSGLTEGRVFYNSTTHKLRVVLNGGTIVSFYTDATTLNAITAPSADVSLNSHKITNLLDPTAAQDAATKNYVDAAIQGLSPKDSVRAASTANIGALSGTQTIDGIALIAGDRVLVKDQTTASANGIYIVAAGAWTRAVDADTANELEAAAVWVEEGTQANTLWTQTAVNFVLGTDPVTWVKFGSAVNVVGGAGLTLTGNTLDVNVDTTTIEINADTLRVKPNTFARRFAADITGDGATLNFNAVHNFGHLDIVCQVWEVTTGAEVMVEKVKTDVNTVQIKFATAPANAKVYRVVVTG